MDEDSAETKRIGEMGDKTTKSVLLSAPSKSIIDEIGEQIAREEHAYPCDCNSCHKRRQMHVEVSNWLDEYGRLPKSGGFTLAHKQGCMLEGLAMHHNLIHRTEYVIEVLRGIASKMK